MGRYIYNETGGVCAAIGVLLIIGGVVAAFSVDDLNGFESARELSQRAQQVTIGYVAMVGGVSLLIGGLILSTIHKVANQVREFHETVYRVVEKAERASNPEDESEGAARK